MNLWKLAVCITFSYLIIIPASGQDKSNCPNSNFILGNFTGWEGYYGNFWDPALHKGFAATRHTIIEAPALPDSNTCNELNPIPPGENFSLKLGNEKVNGEAEQIRYTVNVSQETSLFIYKYAVVLENPNHKPEEQPSFTIEVADTSGTLVDSLCGYYYVYARQGMPTWHTCGDVVWKDWTTVGIDLTKYIGQTVSIIFTTRDCSEHGHFGYAYLSAYCNDLQIVFSYCPGDTVATVTAPPGFSYLWGNGDTTRSTLIDHPVIGMTVSCELTSVNGCKVTITGSFKPTLVNADFEYQPGCVGDTVRFYDSSTINQNSITGWIWDFGDGSPVVTNVQDPEHVFTSEGSFSVTLIVSSSEGCPDEVTKPVNVIPYPEVDFTSDVLCGVQKLNDTIYFDEPGYLEVAEGYGRYTWNTGDSTHSVWISREGWYKVKVENTGLCSKTDSVMMLYCNLSLMIPNAFTPNSDGLNDLFRPVSQSERIASFSMSITDRWGRYIFETQDLSRGWDGTVEGQPAPPGVYLYSLTYLSTSGEQKIIRGTVTLVR